MRSFEWPDCTDTLSLQTKAPSGAWTTRATGILPDIETIVTAPVVAGLLARFVGHSSGGSTNGPDVEVSEFCCNIEVPDQADPPAVEVQCADGVEVTAGAFGAGVTYAQLSRDGVPVHIFDAPGSWLDTEATSPGTYVYRLAWCNADGCGEWSTPVTADNRSAIVVTWNAPAASAMLTGTVTLIATIALNGETLDSFEFLLNGTPIGTATPSPGNPLQFSVTLDTTALEWQGAIQITARATDANGCAASAVRSFQVNNTLESGVRWLDVRRTEATGLLVDRVFAQADVIPATEARDYIYEFGIKSPAPGPAADYTDAEAMEAAWGTFTPVLLDDNAPITNDDRDHTVQLRIRRSARRLITMFALNVGTWGKIRGSGESRWIWASPFLCQYDGTGLSVLVDVRDWGVAAADVLDAAWDGGDNVWLTTTTGVLLIDRTTNEVSHRISPLGETLPARFAEYAGEPLLIYTDTGATHVYAYAPNSLRRVVELATETVLVTARGDALLLAGADGVIREFSDDMLVELHTSTTPPVRALAGADGYIWYADDADNVWRVDDAATLEGNGGFQLAAIAEWKGTGSVPRLAVGGDDEHLLYRNAAGTLLPYWAAESDAVIRALDVFTSTLVPAEGETPAVETEQLLIGVSRPSGDYLARIEVAALSAYSYNGAGLRNIYMEITETREATEE